LRQRRIETKEICKAKMWNRGHPGPGWTAGIAAVFGRCTIHSDQRALYHDARGRGYVPRSLQGRKSSDNRGLEKGRSDSETRSAAHSSAASHTCTVRCREGGNFSSIVLLKGTNDGFGTANENSVTSCRQIPFGRGRDSRSHKSSVWTPG